MKILSKILGCDVDCVLLDTPALWNSWCAQYLLCSEKEIKEGCPYDIRDLYLEELAEKPSFYREGLLEFWRSATLYDKLKPLEESILALREAHEKGWEVVFISQTKGDHSKSKYYFLKEHYPFLSGFIATKEKHYVRADVMIDDRNKVLNKFDDNTLRIWYDTPYKQCEPLERYCRYMNDWNHLGRILDERT